MKGWTYFLLVLLVMCSSTSSCMCPDKDGDGYVVVSGECRIPTGKKAGDCKDNDASIHPGAVDIANNMIDEDCDGTDLDTLPPTAEMTHPTDGASNVPIDSIIIIHVKDSGRGVSQSTIVMTIEGVAVTPAITGNPSDYNITYGPFDFPHQHQVNVTIAATDQAGNPMSTPFSFITASPSGSPWVTADDDGDDIPNGEEVILGTNPDKKTLFVKPITTLGYWTNKFLDLFPPPAGQQANGRAYIKAFSEAEIEVVVIGAPDNPHPPMRNPAYDPANDPIDFDPNTNGTQGPHVDIMEVWRFSGHFPSSIVVKGHTEFHPAFFLPDGTSVSIWRWDTKGYTPVILGSDPNVLYLSPEVYKKPLDCYMTEGAYPSIDSGEEPDWLNCKNGPCDERSPLNLHDNETGPPYTKDPDNTVEFNDINFDVYGVISNVGAMGTHYFRKDVLRRTIVHEMGHGLHLEHCSNPYCIMYWGVENWEIYGRIEDPSSNVEQQRYGFGSNGPQGESCTHSQEIQAGGRIHNTIH